MSVQLSHDQQYPLRLQIAEQQLASYINAYRQQHALNLMLIDAMQRARAAIFTAITNEDGLDGAAGDLMLEYTRQVLAANGVTDVDVWGNEQEPECS